MTDATGQLDVFQAYTNVMRQSVLTAIGRSYYNTPAWNLAISQDTQLGAMQRNIQAAAGVNTFNGAALASANTSAEVTIGHWADSTTSVATLTYEFFTGKTTHVRRLRLSCRQPREHDRLERRLLSPVQLGEPLHQLRL